MTSLLEFLEKEHPQELSRATDHIFVKELCDGTLDDAILYTYLEQDLKFFNLGMRLLAHGMSLCTEPSSVITLGKQVGFLSNSEATYFKLTIAELREHPEVLPPAMYRQPSETLPQVEEFLNFLETGIQSTSYTEIITRFYIFELIYLMWAQKHGSNHQEIAKLAYKHKEWVYLHLGPDFERWVSFLGSEVERVTTNPVERKIAEDIARRVLVLEGDFFDSCYNYAKK